MLSYISTLTTKAYILAQTAPDAPDTAPGGGTIDVQEAQNTITDTALWQNVIGPLSIFLGVIVVIVGAYKVITQLLGGKAQGAFKTIFMTVLVAGLLFRLDLLFTLIGLVGSVIAALINALSDLIGGA